MSDEATIPLPETILGSRDGKATGKRIKLYDFRRPDKFSREQLRTMQIIAESFSRLATTSLSAILRLPCALSLETVDQMTYDEFMAPLASPCAIAVASMQPLKGQVVLHLDAAGADAILERVFGATPAAVEKPLAHGGLTDIEVSQLERIFSSTLEALGTAWSFVDGMKPRLAQVEAEARFCQIVPPNEMIVLTSFNLAVGEAKGKLDIAYPFLVLESIIGMLSAKYWFELRNPVEPGPGLATARRAELPAQFVCDAGAMTIDALRSLRKGSVIPVPRWDEGKAWLRLGGARVTELSGARRDGGFVTASTEGSQEPATSADKAAKDPLALLTEELRDGLATMSKHIDELKGGQDDLSDRVLYGQADAAGGRPQARPFASLAGIQPTALALFLASERPQICALVLSYIDDAAGARLLSLLPEPAQPGITKRIAAMGGVAQDVLVDVERILGKKLSAIDRSGPAVGGIQKVVGILNFSPRETERLVITSLDSSDPELAESIKRNMFVFEDIIILDDESIAAVLEEADEQDIVVAMKPMKEEERERLLGRFPADSRQRLRTAYEALGRVRLAECDAAGFRVVEIIRRLEKEGRIGVVRQGEGF